MFSDETSSSATVAKFSSDFSIYRVDFSLFWALNLLCHLPFFFEFLIFVYFSMLRMLFIVNEIKLMALHGSHTSQITSSKILVTQTLFRVSNEIGPILFSRFLGNNSSKKLLVVGPKKRAERKRVEKRKLERQLQSFLHYT